MQFLERSDEPLRKRARRHAPAQRSLGSGSPPARDTPTYAYGHDHNARHQPHQPPQPPQPLQPPQPPQPERSSVTRSEPTSQDRPEPPGPGGWRSNSLPIQAPTGATLPPPPPRKQPRSRKLATAAKLATASRSVVPAKTVPRLPAPGLGALRYGVRLYCTAAGAPAEQSPADTYHVDLGRTGADWLRAPQSRRIRARSAAHGHQRSPRPRPPRDPPATAGPVKLSIVLDSVDQTRALKLARVTDLLFARQIDGHRAWHHQRSPVSFSDHFTAARYDDLVLDQEFTGAAGDIVTISWVSPASFVCGTTVHSDSHNQQYNRPGNLLLAAADALVVHAYPDHRIVRPVVAEGENSTEAMRQSQDPWLYTSVVSSTHMPDQRLVLTSGFDQTVKAWHVHDEPAGPMTLAATWPHRGNVNFVAAAQGRLGLVATASDVPHDAVRIYALDPDDIAASRFVSLSCSRVQDPAGGPTTDRWAYYPAAVQWGQSPETSHHLLVGYSPRSMTGDDADIPEDRKNTGEICLWDCRHFPQIDRIRVSGGGATQNVFELAWHPHHSSFIVATSPCGVVVEKGVKTQIRLFLTDADFHRRQAQAPAVDDDDDIRAAGARRSSRARIPLGRSASDPQGYTSFQTLDCMATDLNEITIRPITQSLKGESSCYVTAAATDGKIYVWDTARGDKPIHVLSHGPAMEDLRGERGPGYEDTGVKFTAWGSTADRFYTGSADGFVKEWNVRRAARPLVRDILVTSGAVSCGAFNADRSRLAIGDSSGKIYLLSLGEDTRSPDEPDRHGSPDLLRRAADQPGLFSSEDRELARRDPARAHLLHSSRTRGKPIVPHPAPEPPPSSAAPLGAPPPHATGPPGQEYLQSGQLRRHPKNVIGIIQGPNYHQTGLYRREAHQDLDPLKPLLPEFDRHSLDFLDSAKSSRRRRAGKVMSAVAPDPSSQDMAQHASNTRHELSLRLISPELRAELARDRVDFDQEDMDYGGFDYEEGSNPEED